MWELSIRTETFSAPKRLKLRLLPIVSNVSHSRGKGVAQPWERCRTAVGKVSHSCGKGVAQLWEITKRVDLQYQNNRFAEERATDYSLTEATINLVNGLFT